MQSGIRPESPTEENVRALTFENSINQGKNIWIAIK